MASKNGSENANTETVEVERPKLSAKEKKALFDSWKAADAAREKAENSLDTAKRSVSNSIKAIFDKIGPGTFKFEGRNLVLMHRKPKNSEEETYYFRPESSGELQEIA